MDEITLPLPQTGKGPTLAATINMHRSHRCFLEEPITLGEAGQILWAAAGNRIGTQKGRTTPSAGSCYPIRAYICTGPGSVEGLDAGLYQYNTDGHSLSLLKKEDLRRTIAEVALHQAFVATAPVILILAAEPSRDTEKFGSERGMRYVFLDAGHVAQNVYLQAAALDLGTVAVGAFRDKELGKVLELSGSLQPIYVMPVGRPGEESE